MDKPKRMFAIDRTPAYVHHRAMLHRRDNDNIHALELLRRAVQKAPDNREYRLDLAELYCDIGCHEQSSRLLLDMLAEENPPAECYYGLALNDMGVNRSECALAMLGRYMEQIGRAHV